MAHAGGRHLLACLRRVLLLHREALLVLVVLSRTARAGSIGRGAVLPGRPLELWAGILEVWPPIEALAGRRGARWARRSVWDCSLEQPGGAAVPRVRGAACAARACTADTTAGSPSQQCPTAGTGKLCRCSTHRSKDGHSHLPGNTRPGRAWCSRWSAAAGVQARAHNAPLACFHTPVRGRT